MPMRRATILSLIDSIVLDRAAQPMPTELGTLDAIHLASALLWKDAMGIDPVMATHDGALGLAARAHGLLVLGTWPGDRVRWRTDDNLSGNQ
jgi:hypothetical protein